MKKECAWCLAKEGKEPTRGEDVTHGMCEACVKEQLEKREQQVKEG